MLACMAGSAIGKRRHFQQPYGCNRVCFLSSTAVLTLVCIYERWHSTLTFRCCPLITAEDASHTSQSCVIACQHLMHGRHRSLPALPCTAVSALPACPHCTSLASC